MQTKYLVKVFKIIIVGLFIANITLGPAQAAEFDKSSIGISAHLYNWSNNLFPQYEDTTENFGIVRDGAWWDSLEKTNLEHDGWNEANWSYKWKQTTLCAELEYLSGYDTLVQRFQNADSPELLLVLDLENEYFALIKDIGPDQDDIYYDYVYHVVERYDGDGYNDMPGLINPVNYYEIGNEPDYDQWYIDEAYLTPENYVKHRLIPGYKAVKDACEKCVVMNAGLGMQGDGNGKYNRGTFTTDYLEKMYDTIIEYNNKINNDPGANNFYMDRIAIHYYNEENEISKNINDVNQIIQTKEGKSKHIWVTEFGFQTDDEEKDCNNGIISREEDQASLLIRYLALMIDNEIEKSIIYNLKDSSSTFDERMGFYKATCQNLNVEVISPKVSLIAYNTMVNTLERLDFEDIYLESKPKTPSEDGTKDLYKAIFYNSDKKVTLLWYTENDGTNIVNCKDWASEKTTVTIPIGLNNVEILQMDGSSSTPIIVNNNGINEVTLEIGERPIYLIEEKLRERIPESRPSFWESFFSAITKTIEVVNEAIEGVQEYFIPEAHSAAPTPASTPPPILSPTLSVLPLSGQQGQTFSFSGNQYTPNGIVEWNVRKPDGVEYLPEDLTGKVDGSGNFNHNYVSSCGNQIGTYTIWAIDKSTGKRSNDATEIITTSDSCGKPSNPTTPSDYEGKLLRQTGDLKVYLTEGGEKRHFTSPEALEWNGHSFDDIIEVSVDVINSFEPGADLSITQAIINKYNALGGAATFGLTAGTGEQTGYPDNAGVICTYVNFQKGAIEYFTNGDQVGNAYAILNPFFSKWASMGYGNSVLGYPIDDMSDIQTSKFGTEFKYQNFKNRDENGSLEYNLATGEVFEIHGAIYATWSAIGYANSELGVVTSDERDALRSFKGTTGRVSDFENGHLHWHSSGDHAGTTYMTYGNLDILYVSMGGTNSWLGFPVMHQEDRDGYDYCEFEGGYIEWDGSEYIATSI